MRMIDVTTTVFAAIWAARRDGEDTEDAILRRLLRCGSEENRLVSLDGSSANKSIAVQQDFVQTVIEHPASNSGSATIPSGFQEGKYNFSVPEGFEIFRDFKGQRFVARASERRWILENNGKSYRKLAALSEAIGARGENAWNGWRCRNDEGRIVSLGSLRSPDTIQKRSSLRESTMEDVIAAFGHLVPKH